MCVCLFICDDCVRVSKHASACKLPIYLCSTFSHYLLSYFIIFSHSILIFPMTLSLSGLPSDVSHFISCGVDKVLLKPLDMEAFVRVMRRGDGADNDVTQDTVNQRDITLHDVTLSQKGGLEYGRV